MTLTPPAEWELTIALPLGVIDRQLRRIEDQLRLIGREALEFGEAEDEAALRRDIKARLASIDELLRSIHALVADIGLDIQPMDERRSAVRGEEDTASPPLHPSSAATRASCEAADSSDTSRLRSPDRDD